MTLRRLGLAALGVVVVVVALATVLSSRLDPAAEEGGDRVLARLDYAAGLPWRVIQQPAGKERITVTAAPGAPDDPGRPRGDVMRVELRRGDRTETSGYVAARAEVYARSAPAVPADRWPDPVGAERWYALRVFVPPGFPTATDGKWVAVTQFKGLHGGSPPVALLIDKDHFRLGGTRMDAGHLPQQDLGGLAEGRWTRFVIGMRLSPDPRQGWVEVWRDGALRVRRSATATMDLRDGAPDPVYLKQGLYRASAWTVTQTLFFGPVLIGRTRAAVAS